eukprot:Nk52_evm1s95 gene=Nk52_evmTU1s95
MLTKYILTVIDYLTKWAIAETLSDLTTATVVDALLPVFRTFGNPEAILTDRGPQFTSVLFHEVAELLEVHLKKTVAYHPQCNGLVERLNGTLKRILEKITSRNRWPKQSPLAVSAYKRRKQQADCHLTTWSLEHTRERMLILSSIPVMYLHTTKTLLPHGTN